jgi:hypothetical protein
VYTTVHDKYNLHIKTRNSPLQEPKEMHPVVSRATCTAFINNYNIKADCSIAQGPKGFFSKFNACTRMRRVRPRRILYASPKPFLRVQQQEAKEKKGFSA